MNKIEGGKFSKVTVDDIPFVFILFPAVICCHANHFTKYTTEQNIPLLLTTIYQWSANSLTYIFHS